MTGASPVMTGGEPGHEGEPGHDGVESRHFWRLV